jgi:hypothetical protein
VRLANLIVSIALLATSAMSYALTANKVWMEFRTNGRYRVFVNYTVPEQRQFREAYVDFSTKKEAESFFFDLVRGADFSIPNAADRVFTKAPLKADPW